MKKRLFLSAFAASTALVSMGQQMADLTTHSKYILAVDEYVPAPGQFVNTMPKYEDGDDAASMAEKCTKAIAAGNNGMITLGAYGGYVTFHFDHSIANIDGQNDFYIRGNAMKNGSEPGIVMVSKDANRNGVPDDAWYELSGSADVDSAGKVKYGYSVTYTFDAMNNVPWTDNAGNKGTVDRNSFHQQEYFPLWLGEQLTFTGTLLPQNCVNNGASGQQNWVLNTLRYGYADNAINTDSAACSFDISWAVDANRNPVELDFIDFVRVYTGVNQQCGWIGETSTEISGAEDLHLQASLDAIVASPLQEATFEEIELGEESYWNGSDKRGTQIDGGYGSVAYANTFVSGSFRFNNTYNETWNSWSGFAVSNTTSVVFNNYDTDQYNSAVGHGHDGSANYAVVYPYGERIEVMNKPEGEVVGGFYVTNTANNVKAYTEGDGMTGKFEAGDWCKLTITGYRADGTSADVEVYLADYRSASEAERGYIDNWQWVDLTSLGKVVELGFAVSSSHNNEYGMTTPGYFCMDGLNGEPDFTSGIPSHSHASAADAVEVERYTIGGTRISSPVRGVNIIKMSDGTVRKVFVK